MKNNKGFSLVELIIVIAIMAILVGVMAPQLIKYIEKTNVSADTQLAGTVQTAVVTAMMDPEVLNDASGKATVSALQAGSWVNLSGYINSSDAFTRNVSETLGVSAYSSIQASLKSNGASTVMISVGSNNCAVSLPGTDSRGSKAASGFAITIY